MYQKDYQDGFTLQKYRSTDSYYVLQALDELFGLPIPEWAYGLLRKEETWQKAGFDSLFQKNSVERANTPLCYAPLYTRMGVIC